MLLVEPPYRPPIYTYEVQPKPMSSYLQTLASNYMSLHRRRQEKIIYYAKPHICDAKSSKLISKMSPPYIYIPKYHVVWIKICFIFFLYTTKTSSALLKRDNKVRYSIPKSYRVCCKSHFFDFEIKNKIAYIDVLV